MVIPTSIHKHSSNIWQFHTIPSNSNMLQHARYRKMETYIFSEFPWWSWCCCSCRRTNSLNHIEIDRDFPLEDGRWCSASSHGAVMVMLRDVADTSSDGKAARFQTCFVGALLEPNTRCKNECSHRVGPSSTPFLSLYIFTIDLMQTCNSLQLSLSKEIFGSTVSLTLTQVTCFARPWYDGRPILTLGPKRGTTPTNYLLSRLCHDVSSWGPRCQRCLSMPVVIPGKEKDFPQRSVEVYISDVPKGQHCWLDNPHGSTNVQPPSLLSLSSSSSSSPPPAPPPPPSVIHESQGAIIMIHDIFIGFMMFIMSKIIIRVTLIITQNFKAYSLQCPWHSFESFHLMSWHVACFDCFVFFSFVPFNLL